MIFNVVFVKTCFLNHDKIFNLKYDDYDKKKISLLKKTNADVV
jgi:hypothetical protein